METLARWIRQLKEFLDVPLLKFGESELTLWTLLYSLILLILLLLLSSKTQKWVAKKILRRSNLDFGMREAIGTVTRYLIFAVGLLIILQTAGIDLTTLNVLAGTVGLGIGFGLQNIANNILSGLIILFERPIKIGDRIEVGSVEGDVVKIGARSSTVITNDNIAIIVPNSKFIEENVTNWSHNDESVRFKIPVAVAYGTDVRLVQQLLIDVARKNPDVLDEPSPGIRFIAFGDHGLIFELRAWSNTLTRRKGLLISALNFAIYDAFKEHKIEIPFPQRDIHIRSSVSAFK